MLTWLRDSPNDRKTYLPMIIKVLERAAPFAAQFSFIWGILNQTSEILDLVPSMTAYFMANYMHNEDFFRMTSCPCLLCYFLNLY